MSSHIFDIRVLLYCLCLICFDRFLRLYQVDVLNAHSKAVYAGQTVPMDFQEGTISVVLNLPQNAEEPFLWKVSPTIGDHRLAYSFLSVSLHHLSPQKARLLNLLSIPFFGLTGVHHAKRRALPKYDRGIWNGNPPGG